MPKVNDNATVLRKRHYLRNATASNRWFDFASSKVDSYKKRYGDDFCLIVNGAHDYNDAFVLPFSFARTAFTMDALDHRGRWVGTIIDSTLLLAPSNNSLRVANYHNAFHLVGL